MQVASSPWCKRQGRGDPYSGRVTTDANGNLLKRTDALGGMTSYTHNSFDEMTLSADPMGNVTTYAYNSIATSPGASSVYNASQQLCWSSSPAVALGGSPGGCSTPPWGATAYSYDPSGQLTSVSIPSNGTVSLSYGPYGNLACFTPPNSSGYNCSGNPWKGYTSTYTYNADRLRMSVTPDGASTPRYLHGTPCHRVLQGSSRMLRTTTSTDRTF